METTQIATHKVSRFKVGGWLTALFTLVMGCAALLTVISNPTALPMAFLFGAAAIMVRLGYKWSRTADKATAEEAATANVGLVIAGIAVAPLILFALLWTSLLLIIGGAWLLHLVGLA